MTIWSKVKFYYQKALSGLTATSTAAGYSVQNLYNMLESTLWKATSSADQEIVFDAGSGQTYTADYLAIANHNLKDVGATIALQFSDDNFVSDIRNVFTPYAAGSNKALVKEGTSQTGRYSKVKLSGMTGIPFMAICIWGPLTEIGVAQTSFDPNAQNNKASVNISSTGHLLGIHATYIERTMALIFNYLTPATYAKLNLWWETSGMGNFFIAWNLSEDATAVYLMRPSNTFKSPHQADGQRRQVTINLTGRKE